MLAVAVVQHILILVVQEVMVVGVLVAIMLLELQELLI
jgi:hypothetical protein